MRLIYLFSLTAMISAAFISKVYADDIPDETVSSGVSGYVEVRQAFPNVYRKLDPVSNIIGQPKKGDYLELISEGNLWYKVRMRDMDGNMQEGYLERRAGRVVARKGSSAAAINIIIALSIIALISLGTWLHIKKQQKVEISAGLED